MFAHMAIIRDILVGAQKRNGDLNAMCDELEISSSDLFHSDLKVSFEKIYRAWEIAIRHTEDPQLGLHLGELTNPSMLGLVGHLMQTCPDLKEAFKAVCSFSALVTDTFNYSLSAAGNQVTLSYQACVPWVKISPESARHMVDQAMAGTLSIFRILSGRKVLPDHISFAQGRPKNPSEYERVFQSSISWNAAFNSLLFRQGQLSTSVLSYDESLMGVFCELIKKRYSELKGETFENQIRSEIMTTFMGQLPSIESLAARLNMTVRTFQRKLEAEGLSYRELCNSIGKDFAASLLSNQDIKIIEVAAALGYSDARAFQRAFKSWTGQSPRKYREMVLQK